MSQETALQRYLATRSHGALTELADAAGCSVSRLSRIKNGKSRASWELANRIVAATGGEVTLADLGYEAA